MPGIALIVAGGARPDPLVVNALPPVDFCVAADGGADYALALGLELHAVVGDMDSVSEAGLGAVRAAGVEIQQHAAEKDRTDLELAFERALVEQPDCVLVIGIGGGRLDHQLANVAVLAAESHGDVLVDGLIGSARLSVVRGERTLAGALGETISLLPVLGSVEGVTTTGLEFELTDEPLNAGTARGVSNRFVSRSATVSVRKGTLLAVQPFALKDRGPA